MKILPWSTEADHELGAPYMACGVTTKDGVKFAWFRIHKRDSEDSRRDVLGLGGWKRWEADYVLKRDEEVFLVSLDDLRDILDRTEKEADRLGL